MADFTLFSNQNATLVVTAISGVTGLPRNATGIAGAVDHPEIMILAPNPGFPDQFACSAQAAGTATVTVSGTNGEGTPISKLFVFEIDLAPTDPATTFSGALQNVVTRS